MQSRSIKGIFRGTLVSAILNVLLLIILSIIMINTNIDEERYNLIFYLICEGSLALGALYGAKYSEKKGLIIGICISLIFSIVMWIFISVSGDIQFLSNGIIKKTLINVIVGAVSGVIGVNL